MAAVVRIHRPALSQEERERKIEWIRNETIKIHRAKENRHG
jgi:hypothetical protein